MYDLILPYEQSFQEINLVKPRVGNKESHLNVVIVQRQSLHVRDGVGFRRRRLEFFYETEPHYSTVVKNKLTCPPQVKPKERELPEKQ